MKATVVGHATDVLTLQALRHTLGETPEAILCSAFVRRAGVHLIEPQLTTLGARASWWRPRRVVGHHGQTLRGSGRSSNAAVGGETPLAPSKKYAAGTAPASRPPFALRASRSASSAVLSSFVADVAGSSAKVRR